jgi:hypothetical protein
VSNTVDDVMVKVRMMSSGLPVRRCVGENASHLLGVPAH